jgi:hypothetical protein
VVICCEGGALVEELDLGLEIGEATVEVDGLLAEDGKFGGEE